MRVLFQFVKALTYSATAWSWYAVLAPLALPDGPAKAAIARPGLLSLALFCILPCFLGAACNAGTARVANRTWSLLLVNAVVLSTLLAAGRTWFNLEVSEAVLTGFSWASALFTAVELGEASSSRESAGGGAESFAPFFCVNGAAVGASILFATDARRPMLGLWTWFLAQGLCGAMAGGDEGGRLHLRASAAALIAIASLGLGFVAGGQQIRAAVIALAEALVFLARQAWIVLLWVMELLGANKVPPPAGVSPSYHLRVPRPREQEALGPGRIPSWLLVPLAAASLLAMAVALWQLWKLLTSPVKLKDAPDGRRPGAKLRTPALFLAALGELLRGALRLARSGLRILKGPISRFLRSRRSGRPRQDAREPGAVAIGCYRWLVSWARKNGAGRMPHETPLEHGRRLCGLLVQDEHLARCILDIVEAFMVCRYGTGPIEPRVAMTATQARETLSGSRPRRKRNQG